MVYLVAEPAEGQKQLDIMEVSLSESKIDPVEEEYCPVQLIHRLGANQQLIGPLSGGAV